MIEKKSDHKGLYTPLNFGRYLIWLKLYIILPDIEIWGI